MPLIQTTHLFPLLDEHLLALLRTLSPEEWEKQTIAPRWRVKDVAAHLLDGNIRALSMLRDGYFGEQPGEIRTYQELLGYLNGLNADWTQALRRVSPAVLVEMLEMTGRQFCDYVQTLDPHGKALFSVAWAGEEESANWFHLAREYTEKWHHQQQIRLAVGQEKALYTRELYFPHLDTSMRALPHHFRTQQGRVGEVLAVTVTGEGGGTWWLQCTENQWELTEAPDNEPICSVELPGEIAWRIFTKGIDRAQAAAQSRIIGPQQALGEHVFSMLAVMA